MNKTGTNKIESIYEFDVCIDKGVRYRTSEKGKWVVLKKGPISANEIAQVVVQAVITYENMHNNGTMTTGNMTKEEISKYFEALNSNQNKN